MHLPINLSIISLSIYLPINLSIYLPINLSIYYYLLFYLTIYLKSIYLPISRWNIMSAAEITYNYINHILSIYRYIYQSIYLSIPLSIYLPIHLFIYPTIYLSFNIFFSRWNIMSAAEITMESLSLFTILEPK